MCRLPPLSIWCVFGLYIMVLAQDPVANLPQGRIVGIKTYTERSETPVEIYYGVPYATPPKGRYRFSAPEKHTGWKRTFYAHRIPPHCPDIEDGDNDNYSEDCLFLNIWTPRRPDGKTVPVVVMLYSESWIRGGVSLPCQELAAEGVVVVTVTYRLHLLSFFTLRSISARGNLALLDQYLALLWVRDNIAAFGGDPTSVTLLGHSAGADSVLHHITSPRSNGLFQRAIIMSPFDMWKAIDDKRDIEVTETERISRKIAQSLGCTSDSDHEILHCMRGRPLSDILSFYSNDSWSETMQPVSDNFLPESEQYLPKSLREALSAPAQPSMQLDVLLGANDLEVLNYKGENYQKLMKQSNLQLFEYANKKVTPEILRQFSLDRPEALPMLAQAVHWEYWNDKTGELCNVEFLGRLESSAKWTAGVELVAARLARRVTRLYVYRFSQPSGVDLQGRNNNFTGAVHGSDLVALLGDALMLQVARRPASPHEKRVSLLLRRHIVNFIKFGLPGEDGVWQRYKTGYSNTYDIRDMGSVNGYYRSPDRDVRFWLQYLPQLYNNIMNSAGKTEQLTSYQKGENRLRGGVFAMCGVAIVLLLLLFVCIIVLRRQQSRRFTFTDDNHH